MPIYERFCKYGRCYYFNNKNTNASEAERQCTGIFGPNTNGKLAEPVNERLFSLMYEQSLRILGAGSKIHMGFKKLTNDSGTFIVQSSNGTEAWDICNRKIVSRYFPRLYIISETEIPTSWVFLAANARLLGNSLVVTPLIRM